MALSVEGYCGVQIEFDQDGAGAKDVATASSVEASWQTPASLWDDGVSKYIFWGDTTGQFQAFDLQTTAEYGTASTVYSAFSSGATGGTGTVFFPKGAAKIVWHFVANLFDMNVKARRLKQLGDIYAMEGAWQWQILEANAG